MTSGQEFDSELHRPAADKAETFGLWLAERHARMSTSPGVIHASVRQAVGTAPVLAMTRIVIGQMNEVYDVELGNGQRLIVRISHQADARFEAERWALDAAREAGAPTPRVLLVQQMEDADHPIAVCVQEKLPGTPLDQLLRHGTLDQAGISAADIAAALAAIHSVVIDGFGYLQPDGRGWEISFRDIMLDLIDRADDVRSAARRWQVHLSLVDQGLACLAAHERWYSWPTSRLTHGDFTPEHLLVHSGAISGVIDFQDCCGNHPIFDFAHWQVVNDGFANPVPVGLLRAAYPQSWAAAEDFDVLLSLVQIRWSLWMLMVREQLRHPEGVADVLPRLTGELGYLRRHGAGGW
jgi:Ser/Thr protein kinase RdoA (MazF antagonist)